VTSMARPVRVEEKNRLPNNCKVGERRRGDLKKGSGSSGRRRVKGDG